MIVNCNVNDVKESTTSGQQLHHNLHGELALH